MRKAKYKVGDLVKSKAGGTKMVIDDIDVPPAVEYDDGLSDVAMMSGIAGAAKKTGFDPDDPARDHTIKYECVWWAGQKQHRDTFSEETLEPWTDGA